MKKLLLVLTIGGFVSSCGGGLDACSCIEKSAELAQKALEEGADIEALTKESTKLATDCAAAEQKDAEAWAEALKGCK